MCPSPAINFFAQHGSSSPIKFVHLIKSDTGITYRPYDLSVVPPLLCAAGTSYYTMSSAGLVHVAPNVASEFIPLAEWMRQSTNFNMLRAIRFYKYYLHTKAFMMWRNNVRYKLYCNQRKKISNNLFLAKVRLRRASPPCHSMHTPVPAHPLFARVCVSPLLTSCLWPPGIVL